MAVQEPNTYNVKLQPAVLLVAQPELLDPNFAMSVVLVCQHGEEGSLGLVLNRPTNLFFNPYKVALHDQQRDELDFPVYLGGPVQPQALFFLYLCEETLSGAIEVLPGLYMSSNPETMRILRERGPMDGSFMRFFIGYSGWSYYQLDCEASSGAWFAHPAKKEFIFTDPKRNLWLEVLKDMGEEFYGTGRDFLNSLRRHQPPT